MHDTPDYDITELLLCGFFIAGAISCLIWAGASLCDDESFTATEAAGLSLMLLGGCAHPKKYLFDCLSFPLSFIDHSGRETPVTVFAAGAGLVLWLAGLAGNHFG